MEHAKLVDSLDGLHAYDSGAVDSGIHDETLRGECFAELAKHPQLAEEIAHELYGKPPYGPEDVEDFMEWVEDVAAGVVGELPQP